ncbi:MAG: hypothetical protein K0R54_169 [Clostridiaceae bacterium]|jgi:predicted Holliday junction resolvase-like endonuclease|nr:hypothetical protein [Clostridiaceae bacterium]
MSNNASKEYKMLKNYIHNECKITKEDIQNLIKTEIQNQINSLEVQKKIKSMNIEEMIKKEVLNSLCNIYGGFNSDTKKLINNTEKSIEEMRNEAIEKAIADNIIVSLKNIIS